MAVIISQHGEKVNSEKARNFIFLWIIEGFLYILRSMKKLKNVSLFKDLSDTEFKELEPYLATNVYKKKETIFSEGEPPEWFYLVLTGKVKITKLSHDGKEIILEVISPTDIFGGVAVIKGFPYPANAVAMEDSEVLKISRKNLMRLMDRFPNLMYCMAMQMGDRMKSSYDSLKNIALERVEARIAALLLKLAGKVGIESKDGTVIDMRLTKQDVADMVGTTVETSIRTFSKFKKQDLVTEMDGKIVIKDREGLAAFSS
jgi:CRP/FNR family transcriptional regulator